MSMAEPAQSGREPFVRAGIVNLALGVLAAVASYLSLLLIANRFGSSAGSDTYFFVLSLTTIATSLFGSVLGTVFMPLLVELRHKDARQASRFASVVLTWCVLLVLTLCLYVQASPGVFLAIFSKFTAQQIAERGALLAYLPGIIFASVLAEYFRILTIALGRYSWAAVGSVVQPLVLVVGVALFSTSYGAACLPAALLASKCLALLLGVALLKGQGLRLRPVVRGDGVLLRFLRAALPYWSASLVTNYAVFYFDYVATGLPQGTLASLSFAQRIFALPTGMLIIPLLEIARARFAEHRARDEEVGFTHLYNQLLLWTVYLSVPVAALFLLYPHGLVAALLGSGAYTSDSMDLTANCLRVYALSVLLTSIFMLNGRCMESFQRLGWPSLFGTVGNLAMIALTFNLTNRWGYMGIPAARLCTDALYFLPMGFLFLRHYGVAVNMRGLVDAGWKSTLACLPLAALSLALLAAMPGAEGLSRLHHLAIIIAGLLAYAAVLLALDNPLRHTVLHILKNRHLPASQSLP